MITPPYLKPGDTIGIIAPARKISKGEISGFLELLDSWGLKCKFGKNLFGEKDQYSGSDEERAADFQDMINDTGIRAIFPARGGYGSLRTLKHIDFSNFEKDPKWITGFSDITVFHSYVSKFLNCESIHCLMPMNYKKGNRELENSAESLRKALFGEVLEYQLPSLPGNREGEVEAELTGGNLSVLYSLNGTAFFPDMNGKILFIEDIDEYLYHIDRMMLNLFHNGSLNNIKALVVGGFTDIKDNPIPFGKNYNEIISEILEKFKIPLAFNIPSGHQNDNRALIFGRQMQLTIRKDKTSIVFSHK